MKYLDRALLIGPYVAICRDEKEFRKELLRLKLPRHEWPNFMTKGGYATTHFLTNTPKGMICIVCLGSTVGKTRTQIDALLVHEAVHIWQKFVADIGEDHPGDEMEAYAIQNLSQSLMESMK